MSEPPFEMRIDPAKVRARQSRTTFWMAVCCVLSGVVFLIGMCLAHQANATLLIGVLLMFGGAPLLLAQLGSLGGSHRSLQRLLETSAPSYQCTDEGIECKLSYPERRLRVSWSAISNYCIPILSMKEQESTPLVRASGKIYVKVENLEDIVFTDCSEQIQKQLRLMCRDNARNHGGEVTLDTTLLDKSITSIHDNVVKRLTPEQIAKSVLKLKNKTIPTQGKLNIEL